jgi:hypothetical protein
MPVARQPPVRRRGPVCAVPAMLPRRLVATAAVTVSVHQSGVSLRNRRTKPEGLATRARRRPERVRKWAPRFTGVTEGSRFCRCVHAVATAQCRVGTRAQPFVIPSVVEAATQPAQSARPGFPSLTISENNQRCLDYARHNKKALARPTSLFRRRLIQSRHP